MNDPADSIEEIKAHEDLPGDFLDKIKRKSLVVIPLQHFKQINSQDLKDHAEVVAVGTFVEEGVEEVEDVGVVSVELFLVGFVLFE